ncbi:MAG: ROK family protein [Chloroflexi bacterium]|nr:ROK family protein [Chloroflexota bacterium]
MYVLAADIGGSHIRMGLLQEGHVLETESFAVDAACAGLARHLPQIEETARSLCTRRRVSLAESQGIGLALACLVDAPGKRVLRAVKDKYEDAVSLDLPQWGQQRLGLEVVLETDSRAALLGEWRYGAGRGCQNIIMVTLGTAIGVSVLMQGRLLRGAHAQAGLGGHFIVNPRGRACNCGGRGCATAEASTWALPGIAREHPLYAESTLSKIPCIDYRAVFQAAAAGDIVAQEIRDRSLDIWGACIVSLIHAFDPEVVILGGGILGSAETILPWIKAWVTSFAWTPWGPVDVRLAAHLQQAALLGMSSLFDHGLNCL